MLIGLNGKKRSGKDTSALFVREWTTQFRVHEGPFTFYKDAFADRLKVSAARALGFMGPSTEQCVQFCDWLKEDGEILVRNQISKGVTPHSRYLSGREYLQWYGTEAHRNVFDDSFWVDIVLNKYTHAIPNPKIFVVITDCRFENEAEAIRKAGGVVWEIVRPVENEVKDTHASEKPLPRELVDLTITNDKGLDELKAKVYNAVEELVKTTVRNHG